MDSTDELLAGKPHRIKTAEETGVYWDGTAIVIEVTPFQAASLYWLCHMLAPHDWNEDMRVGIANLMEGAPHLFDKYRHLKGNDGKS